MARKLRSARQRVQAEAAAAHAKAAKARAKEELELRTKPARRAAEQRTHAHAPAWLPFDPQRAETVLLVGEGDFSFAAALATKFGALDVVATGLDSAQDAADKYADKVAASVEAVQAAGGTVAHGIDATQLTKHRSLKMLGARGRPLTVVFNFPHLGNSIADQDRNIRQHQELLLAFFREAKSLGASRVVVALFSGEPYESWQPKQLARAAGWRLERSGRFPWDEFPGYEHQLTAKGGARTNRAQRQRDARLFLWTLA